MGECLKYLTARDATVYWPLVGVYGDIIDHHALRREDNIVKDALLEGLSYAGCKDVDVIVGNHVKTAKVAGTCIDKINEHVLKSPQLQLIQKEKCFKPS